VVTKVNLSKGSFDLTKYFESEIKKKERRAISVWQKTIPGIIIKKIKDSVGRGNPPVSGFTRYKGYSQSYKDQILGKVSFRKINGRIVPIRPQLFEDAEPFIYKKIRPVNLLLTGAMMRSLIYRPTQKGFVVYFTNKLAKIHSEEGAGKSKVIRKLMPSGTEKFKRDITIESDKFVDKILKKEFNEMF
jgi:hypothetical protein